VVAAYESQFARNHVKNFDLSGLDAAGGPAGRATARYRTGQTTGTMTWTVIREKGKPRITMVTADPD